MGARATARVITAPGSVTARRGTSARRASTPTAPRIAPGTVAAILSRGGASARITIRQISSRGANFARSTSPPPRARTPPWTSAWTPRDDAWFLCNSAACSASTSARRRSPSTAPRRTPSRGRRATALAPAYATESAAAAAAISHRHARPDRPSRLFGLFGIRRVQRVADSSVPGGTVPIRARSAKRGVVEGRVASDVVRGLGMLPPATPRNPRRSPSTSPPCDAKICDSRDSTRDRASSEVVSLGGGGGAARARMKIRCAGLDSRCSGTASRCTPRWYRPAERWRLTCETHPR